MTDRDDARGRAAAALFAGVALLGASGARAAILPAPVRVETEEDLREYYEDGVLDEQQYETLLELLHDPLDLNRARWTDLYDLPGVSGELARAIVADRRENGPFATVDRLLRVRGMTADVLEQVRPFVRVVARPVGARAWTGYARLKGLWTFEPPDPLPEDDHPYRSHTPEQLGKGGWPSGYAKVRADYQEWLELGALGLVDDEPIRAEFSEDSRDITLVWGEPRLEAAKAYVAARRGHVVGVLGSYTAGFGSGLVFDDTTRSHPHGLYPDLAVTGTEDYDARRGLFGAGVRLVELRRRDVSVDATLFASSERHDVYQYGMALAGGEPPDADAELESPRVFVEGQRVAYVTVPNAYRETVAGMDLTLGWRSRLAVGAAGYVGHVDRTALPGADDPYDWVFRDGWPDRDTYGAAGLHGRYEAGPVALFGEFAQSFTGGSGAVVEALWDLDRATLEGSLRRYGTDFDNPHARGLAAPDEYDGMRDRDEEGARLDARVRAHERVDVRVMGDIWRNISTGRANAELYGRVEVRPTEDVAVALIGDTRNRDLANNGRTRVYGGDWLPEDGASGEVEEGAGAKHWLAVQGRWSGVDRLVLQLYYKRTWEDAGLVYPNGTAVCEPWYQVGQYAWFKATVRPDDATTAAWRLLYRDDDVFGAHDDRYVETWLQVARSLPWRLKATVRGQIRRDLADPAAPWAEACASGGIPELDGTCIAEVAADEEEAAEGGPTTGQLTLTLEGRF